MINDNGVLRYKPADFSRASFPENHYTQAGVNYFRDFQYRHHPGYVFVEYKGSKERHGYVFSYDTHVYIQVDGPSNQQYQEAHEKVQRLIKHWSICGYSYTLINIGDPDVIENQTPPPKEKKMPNAHHPELDNMSPAQIRVLCEELLYTMDTEQRRKIMGRLPGIYHMAYPGSRPELKP